MKPENAELSRLQQREAFMRQYIQEKEEKINGLDTKLEDSSWGNTLKLGMYRTHVVWTRNLAESQSQTLRQQIEETHAEELRHQIEEGGPEFLINQATAYQQELALRREQFEQMQTLALPESVVERFRYDLHELEAKGKTEYISTGLRLLQEKKQAEKAAASASREAPTSPTDEQSSVIDRRTQSTIELPDGKTITVRGSRLPKLLQALLYAREDGERVTKKDLAIAVLGKYDREIARADINHLLRDLGPLLKEVDWEVAPLFREEEVRGRKMQQYELRQIPLIAEEPAPQAVEDESKKKPASPIFSTHIEALASVIQNRDITMKDMIDILGPSQKTGRLRTWAQVRFSLLKSSSHLFTHIRYGTPSDEESLLWEEIRTVTGLSDDKSSLVELQNKIYEWFNRRLGDSQQEQEIPLIAPDEIHYDETEETSLLSSGEAISLAVLTLARSGTKVRISPTMKGKLELNADLLTVSKEVLQNLSGNNPFASSLNNDEQLKQKYIETRGKMLGKVRSIVTSPDVTNLIEAHEENLSFLLLWMYSHESETLEEILQDFETEDPEVSWEMDRETLLALGENVTIDEAVMETAISQPEPVTIFTADVPPTREPETPSALEQPVLPVEPYEKGGTEMSAKAEERKQKFTKALNSILDDFVDRTQKLKLTHLELSLNLLKAKFSGAQVHKIFPYLTERTISISTGRGVIKRKGPNVPYTLNDMFTLVYAHSYERQLLAKQYQEISSLVSDVVRKRVEEQQEQKK